MSANELQSCSTSITHLLLRTDTPIAEQEVQEGRPARCELGVTACGGCGGVSYSLGLLETGIDTGFEVAKV
jgi:hypothetical protein